MNVIILCLKSLNRKVSIVVIVKRKFFVPTNKSKVFYVINYNSYFTIRTTYINNSIRS